MGLCPLEISTVSMLQAAMMYVCNSPEFKDTDLRTSSSDMAKSLQATKNKKLIERSFL